MALNEKLTLKHATCFLDHSIPELLLQWDIWGQATLAFGSHRQGWEDKANGKCDLPGFTGCVYINYIVFFKIIITYYLGFPGGSDGKESTCKAVDLGSIPGFGRFPGGGHGNPLHILAWRIPMDRGAWWATAQGVAKSRTQLSE